MKRNINRGMLGDRDLLQSSYPFRLCEPSREEGGEIVCWGEMEEVG